MPTSLQSTKNDDQKNPMETQSFNHWPYLNMTAGVLHYRAPLLSTPIHPDISCLVRVVRFCTSRGRVPESTQQARGLPSPLRPPVTQVLASTYKPNAAATAVPVGDAELAEEEPKGSSGGRKAPPQMKRRKM